VTRIIAQDGSVFSQISVQIKDGMTEPLLQIAVPVMSDLKVPLVMNFELEEAVEFQYSFCNAQACFIVEPSSENVLNYLKQKNDVILTLRSIVNGDVRARASLLGFSDAFARLNEYPNDE
jgi:invasion protein IalB